jgi:lysophospholipase L1-like esterase
VRRLAGLLLIVALVVLTACHRRRAAVLFVGDSLTSFPPSCDYARQWAALHPGDALVYSVGLFGSTARQWLDTGQLKELLALRHPTVVVIALGSNDVRSGRMFSVIVSDLRALYDQAEAADGHPKAYVATVPPMYDPPEGDPIGAAALRTKIEGTNQLIRIRFPADRVIDFDSWMPAAWSPEVMFGPNDGVHMGCGGHRLRAEHVDAKLVP